MDGSDELSFRRLVRFWGVGRTYCLKMSGTLCGEGRFTFYRWVEGEENVVKEIWDFARCKTK